MTETDTLPSEYERVEYARSRGRTIKFTGRLLAETEFRDRNGATKGFELWEARSGEYVAVTITTPQGEGQDYVEATKVAPSEDEEARRDAVMDHWSWESRARAMIRKAKLGWTFVEDLDL